MICPIDLHGYCSRHNRRHIGHFRRIALDPSEAGEVYRKAWDGGKVTASENKFLRSLPIALTCIHNTGVNGQAKVGCAKCKTYGCKIKGTVRVSECASCPLFQTSSRHENPPASGGISGVEKSKADFGNSIRFDHENLHPQVIPGIRFNSSIIEQV